MIKTGWVIQRHDGETVLLRIYEERVYEAVPLEEHKLMPTGEYDDEFNLIREIDFDKESPR